MLARVELARGSKTTRNGVRIAIIEPAEQNPLAGLIESGELRPAQGRLPLFAPSEPESEDALGLSAVLDDRYGAGG